MLRTIIIIFLFIFIPFLAVANAFFPGNKPGQTIYPVNSDDIRLVKILIKVDAEWSKVMYTLENTQDKAIDLKIGFPFFENQEPSIRYEMGGRVDGSIKNSFRVSVDGDKVKNIERTESEISDYMYSWYVQFKPKEIKQVECVYSIAWTFDPKEYPVNSSFAYHTTNGSLWKDTIKEADIYIQLDDSISHYLKKGVVELEIEPTEYKVKDYLIIEWHYKNWEPKDDIYIETNRSDLLTKSDIDMITMRKILDRIRDKKKYKGNLKLYTFDDLLEIDSSDKIAKFYARLLRNEIFARHGREFKSEDLKTIFQGTTWYRLNPDYSDDMLNDIERRNIQFILEYEKKKGWR